MDTSWIYKIVDYFFSWIFPESSDISYLERVTASEFASIAKRPIEPPPPDTLCLFNYRDPIVEKAVWALKYRGNYGIARLFAHLLNDVLVEIISDESLFSPSARPLLIPIPLSPKKLRDRGWNQTEMIGRELAKIQPGLMLKTNVLIKIKDTPSQTKLNRTQRVKNLRGCFAVQNPEEVIGKTIILIDDVTTTGSTLAEARRTLLHSGAHRVFAVTVAH